MKPTLAAGLQMGMRLALTLGIFAGFGWCASRAVQAAPPRKTKSEAAPNPLAAATLVIFNSRDGSSESLANYYAKKRGIPAEQIVGLDCPLTEEISRVEYDRSILRPLRELFSQHNWWKTKLNADDTRRVTENKIRFAVLMRGMPLKIAAAPNYPGDKKDGPPVIRDHNEAAVDSELAGMGYFTTQISSALNNPYYRSFTRVADTNFLPLILVCRLDAPSPEIVRRMIDDSLETEKNGLWGFAYIDARGLKDGPHAEGDEWLRRVAEDARHHGLPVIEDDREEIFPNGYPMRHAALYYGWYAGQCSGALAQDGFHFEKGAIAVHIHSLSAVTLRSPHEYWVAPLLSHGAAASLGNVYEPYLSLTPNLDIFNARLLAGFTFAESAYASMRAVSWMTTFVGDPLYRPFRAVNEVFGETPKSTEWMAFRQGTRLWFGDDRAAGEKTLLESATALRSGAIAEGTGLLQVRAEESKAALASFRLARSFYKNPDDIMRVAIHEIRLLAAEQRSEAVALAQRQIRANPRSPAREILQSLLPELAPK